MNCPRCGNVLTNNQVIGKLDSLARTYHCNRCDCIMEITITIVNEGNQEKIKQTKEYLKG